jgi:hypothetical protein
VDFTTLSELTLLWGSVDIDPGRNVIAVAEATITGAEVMNPS